MDKLLNRRTGETWPKFGDITEVEEESFADAGDMVVKAKMGVTPDLRISYGVRMGKVVAKKGNGGNGREAELLRGANTNGFGFGAIEL